MQIGDKHIDKAYLGTIELTPGNAFIGTEPVIDEENIIVIPKI